MIASFSVVRGATLSKRRQDINAAKGKHSTAATDTEIRSRITLNASSTPQGVARLVPSLGWLPSYQRGWLKVDLIAGATAAAVVIPQAMAYAPSPVCRWR